MDLLIDAFVGLDVREAAANAKKLEAAGYDGILAPEQGHDPFMHMLQVSLATERVTTGISVAIAFARSPMTLASSAYDLAGYSEGRFLLGLGSQIKPHIERRFSMPWSHPAARMREFVLALRAIWSSWHDGGTKLSFQGDFYNHTLMTPFFSPKPHQWGPPPVYVAGVGPLMTEAAGEVADGFFFHPLTTQRYLAEVTMPTLRAGREKAGKAKGDNGLEGFGFAGPAFVTVGRNDEELETAIKGTKRQLAFYCSTPAYRTVLDVHGWGEIQPELTRMSKENRWDEMGNLITDEMLHAFSPVGSPSDVAKELKERWAGIATRISLYANYESDPEIWPEVVAGLRS